MSAYVPQPYNELLDSSLSYAAQTLTDPQKAQALTNLGAASVAYVGANFAAISHNHSADHITSGALAKAQQHAQTAYKDESNSFTQTNTILVGTNGADGDVVIGRDTRSFAGDTLTPRKASICVRHPSDPRDGTGHTLGGPVDFSIVPYNAGMAIDFKGIVECWVEDWSIHNNNKGGGAIGEPAILWVGDNLDLGGVRMSGVCNSDLSVMYSEICSETFAKGTHGPLHLIVRSVTDAFHFNVGAVGSEATKVSIHGSGKVGIGTDKTEPICALEVKGTTAIDWPIGGGPSKGLVTIGSQGAGGSLLVQTPSLNSGFASGLAVDGSYSSLVSTVNVTALGVKSGGGYVSKLNLRTTVGTSIVDGLTLDSTSATFVNVANAPGFTATEASKGSIALASGSVSSTGYIAWFKADSTRHTFAGFDSGNDLTFTNEVGGKFAFSSGASFNGAAKLGDFTVGTLPSASANAGYEANVTDSSVTTFGSPVAGGGSSRVKLYSNGTNWTVQAA